MNVPLGGLRRSARRASAPLIRAMAPIPTIAEAAMVPILLFGDCLRPGSYITLLMSRKTNSNTTAPMIATMIDAIMPPLTAMPRASAR
jgi:hypothetical protein